jgi:hypothetical protein
MTKKNYEDIYVTYNGSTMRYSAYIEMMQKMYDRFDWITEAELERIKKEEEEVLKK